MSTITINYLLSQASQKRITVETGQRPTAAQKLTLELADMTTEQRARLLDCESNGAVGFGYRGWRETDPCGTYTVTLEFDGMMNTLDDVFSALDKCAVLSKDAEAKAAKNATARNAAAVEAAEKFLGEREENCWFTNQTLYQNGENYQPAREIVNRASAESARRRDLSDKRAAERVAAEKAEAEAKRKSKIEERLAWAEANGGSQRLVRGLREGHDCGRLFYAERAAVEYPGYAVDFDGKAEWKPATCPTEAALNELDAIRVAHPATIQNAEIVWMTDDTSGDEYSDFEPCEAVAVDDKNFSKWLVKKV